jgi:hypothetical protein
MCTAEWWVHHEVLFWVWRILDQIMWPWSLSWRHDNTGDGQVYAVSYMFVKESSLQVVGTIWKTTGFGKHIRRYNVLYKGRDVVYRNKYTRFCPPQWSRVLGKLTAARLLNKLPAMFWTRQFVGLCLLAWKTLLNKCRICAASKTGAQEAATALHPEPNQSNPHPDALFKMRFNTILPATHSCCKQALPPKVCKLKLLCISHLAIRAACPTNLILVVWLPY